MPPQTNSNLEQRYATNCHGTVGLGQSYLSYHPILSFPRHDDIVDDNDRIYIDDVEMITTLECLLYLSCHPRPCPGRHRSSAWTDVEVGSLSVD